MHVFQLEISIAEELARRCALAVENAALFEEAEQAIRSRDEFIAIVAHELRTPLTALKLRLEGTTRRVTPEEPETAARRSALVTRQVSRLAQLAENLLDISRLTRGAPLVITREVADLSDLVREVTERIAGDAARTDTPIQLKLEDDVRGYVDVSRVEQIFTNLLTNALKFGRGRPIEVTVAQRGEWARLTVADRGPGIAPEVVDHIFDRFAQAVSPREYGGLGLGLYLARKLSEAHGGSITVDSDPGQGTTFTVDLPARQNFLA
jgi:signal transduction histidine kinase